MADVEPMAIADPGQNLLDDRNGLKQGKTGAPGTEIVEQFPALNIFQDKIKLLRGGPDIIHLNNVLVIQQLWRG